MSNLPVPKFAESWARGLDLSHWNTGVNFNPQNLPDFVLQRVSEASPAGVNLDASLDRIYAELGQVRVLGGWHFWSGFKPLKQQVDIYLKGIKGKRYKVHALDWEIKNKKGEIINPNTKESAEAAGEWVEAVRNETGQEVVLYLQSSDYIHLTQNLKVRWVQEIDLWAKYWILRPYLKTASIVAIANLFGVPVTRFKFLQYGGDSGDTTGMGDGRMFGAKSASVDVDVAVNMSPAELLFWLTKEEQPTPDPQPQPETDNGLRELLDSAQADLIDAERKIEAARKLLK